MIPIYRNVICKKSIVAVIDILGAKQLIMGPNQNSSLRDVRFVYDFMQTIQNRKGLYNTRVFSDNILISKNIQGESDTNQLSSLIHDFFVFIGTCQFRLLELGYLSRGGITVGDFYIDDVITWGQALVNAHYIESDIANYPRIVVDDEILSIYTKPADRKSMLLIDSDNKYYVDYLTLYLDCELPKYPYILQTIKSKASSIIDDHVKEKYDWYENYHRKTYDSYDIPAWKERWTKVSPDLARLG